MAVHREPQMKAPARALAALQESQTKTVAPSWSWMMAVRMRVVSMWF
jgi:hypothetical protein